MRAGKENLNNQLPRSLGLQAHDPFRDITNVADCRQSLKDKSGMEFVSYDTSFSKSMYT